MKDDVLKQLSEDMERAFWDSHTPVVERKPSRPWLDCKAIAIVQRRELWGNAIMGRSPNIVNCEELQLAGIGTLWGGMGGPSWDWNESALKELSTEELERIYMWLRSTK